MQSNPRGRKEEHPDHKLRVLELGQRLGLIKVESPVSGLPKENTRFIEAVDSGSLFRLDWVKFKIIDGCNIKCVMCNHWRREGYKKSFLTKKRLISLSAELAKAGTKHVHWTGGEPTIRPDLPEIISHYQQTGITCNITSNGTRMTEEFADRLCTAGLNAIAMSLESSDEKTHDTVVGSPGAWAKLIAGAGFLSSHRPESPKITFQTVLTSINTNAHLIGLVDIAARFGVRRIRFQPITVKHLQEDERHLLPTNSQLAEFSESILPQIAAMGKSHRVDIQVDGSSVVGSQLQKVIGDKHGAGHHFDPAGAHSKDFYTTRKCYLPYYHCTVDYRGNVFVCCHMREEEGLLGNITNQSLMDVLNSDRAKILRKKIGTESVPASCRECTMQIGENQTIDYLLKQHSPVIA